MSVPATQAAPVAGSAQASWYRSYLVLLLATILAFNYVDRLALGLLLQDIKTDLVLSDTELGLLSGVTFAFFYSIMGIPIARWADRGDRVTIIGITTGLWSVAVALCGAAASFAQLALVRVGVAVGEAGCIPPAQSLISDHFGRSERPRAISRYMLGGPFSVVIGYFVAGWLNQLYGWRTTFVLLGLPGLALALIAYLTLRDPRAQGGAPARTEQVSDDASDPAKLGLMPVLALLWRNRTFRHLLLAWSLASFFGQGLQQWQPSFFIRSYGLDTAELGTWFAIIYGAAGIAGIYVGGELAVRRAGRNEALQLRAVAAVYALLVFVKMGVYVAPALPLAFLLTAISAFGGNMAAGPLFSVIQTLVPPATRAMSVAIVLLFANLIGLGLGPLAAGALSDALGPMLGPESLRFSLLALCPGYGWAAWHVWRASRAAAKDPWLADADRDDAGASARRHG